MKFNFYWYWYMTPKSINFVLDVGIIMTSSELYVYTWNAKASMYLFHSDLGNTVHDSIFGETTAQLVLTSKQFSECTEHINLWHLQTTSTWGKGGIKNSMKNTEKRFLLVSTYHENKTRWITLYSQSFNIVKLSC